MKHQPGPFQRFIKPAEMHRTFHGDTQNKQYKEVKMIAHVGKIVSSKSNTKNIHTKHNSSASTRNVSSISMANQGKKHSLIISRSLSSNVMIKSNTISAMVFLLNTFHVNLCPGGYNSSKSPFICPYLLDGQPQKLLKVFFRVGQALNCCSQ